MVKQYFHTMLRRPAFWFISAALGLYTLLGYWIPDVLFSFSLSADDPLLFANYRAYFETSPLCGLILPLFALYMHQDYLFFQKQSVLIKFKTKSFFWVSRIGMIFFNAFCYVLFLYFLFFLRCLTFGILEDTAYYAAPFLLNFLSQVLSFSFFCLLVTFLSEFLHSPALGMVLVFLLMAGDFYFQTVYLIPGVLLRGMWLPLTETSRTLFAIGLTICEIAALAFLLIFTADKRDTLPKKVS